MTPYFEDIESGIVIYHGDCREVLPTLGAVDAIVTDPPYGVNLITKTSDYRDSAAFDNGASLKASILYQDDPDHVDELIRLFVKLALPLADCALVFCGPAKLHDYPRPASIGAVFLPAGAGRSPWGFCCYQPILYYGKDPYLQHGLGGRPNGFRTEQPNTDDIDHPCPKPLSWMTWAVHRVAPIGGELILDPFMGSGTTLVAAKTLHRPAIGIEIEERYCEIAARRIMATPRPLFTEPASEPVQMDAFA